MESIIDKNDVQLINLPDMHINFEGPFLASCRLPNGPLLLDICHEYFRDWFEHQYSIHGLAERLSKEGVSLWSAQHANALLPEEERSKGAFSFCLRFDHMKETFESIVLVQCQTTKRGYLQ